MAKPDQYDQVKSNLADVFKRFDLDSDGSLTQLELAALLRSLGLKPTGDKLYSLLANIDSNGNGSIEFDELVDAVVSQLADTIHILSQDQLREVFDSLDQDGNGYISPTELAKAMGKLGHPLTYKELIELMKEADTDGDGLISFTEFSDIMAKSAAEFFENMYIVG
ncbi:hypothetical protein V2J09_012846 [Rumex salicifolius]